MCKIVENENSNRIENTHRTYITFIYPRSKEDRVSLLAQCSSTIFLFDERKRLNWHCDPETKGFFRARQYLESGCLNIIFSRSRFIPLRFFAERIPNLPSAGLVLCRLRRKSDIALNAVFTWVEVRRLEFIADKPVDARTWPFTIVKLARIHYSLERFAAIIALQRFHIYSLSGSCREISRKWPNVRLARVRQKRKKKSVGCGDRTIHIDR